ncbi:hypothetical protein BH09PLA1_BH09PLA1_15500 [soil metagenome]
MFVSRAGLFILIAIGSVAALAQSTPPGTPAFAPITGEPAKHLDNAHVVTAKVISGAQPDDEAAFAALQQLGIRTIVSVDGAKPNFELARKYGMRYVHLPIGYDGVTEAQGLAIAKALDELPGPIYIHCHHGKHRSAAAVAVACVYNGTLRPDQAEAVLNAFGTGTNYIGLWKAARDARPIDARRINSLEIEFVEVQPIGELAETMVAIDQRLDHLKLAKESGWRAPMNHPDIDPPHEALQLQEHLHEIGRLEEAQSRPAEFRRLLNASDEASQSLTQALRSPLNADGINAAFDRVNNSCTACHKAFRD